MSFGTAGPRPSAPNRRTEALIIAGFVLALGGMSYFFVQAVQHERAEVTAFCQPRGYIGGFLGWRGVGAGCITKDHRDILISEIKRGER